MGLHLSYQSLVLLFVTREVEGEDEVCIAIKADLSCRAAWSVPSL